MCCVSRLYIVCCVSRLYIVCCVGGLFIIGCVSFRCSSVLGGCILVVVLIRCSVWHVLTVGYICCVYLVVWIVDGV